MFEIRMGYIPLELITFNLLKKKWGNCSHSNVAAHTHMSTPIRYACFVVHTQNQHCSSPRFRPSKCLTFADNELVCTFRGHSDAMVVSSKTNTNP